MKLGSIFRLALLAGALALGAVSAALGVTPYYPYASGYQLSPRYDSTHDVEYYRFTINYNDPSIGSSQLIGAFSQGTFIDSIACHVLTPFNAGSTNVVTMGITTAANEIVASSGSNASITASSATYQALTAAAGLGEAVTSGANEQLYVKYAQTGTAATAGQVVCVLKFIPNNDM